MDPRIIDSARKRGFADEDILHAYHDNRERFALGDDKYMVAGFDTAGRLLEVAVVVTDAGLVIIHAMKARPHYHPEGGPLMPRSIEDVLAHADELTAEFEAFDPAGALPLSAEEWRIVEATAAHAAAERALRDAVVAARAADVSWRAIARILGISHQAAHRRYAQWAGEESPAPPPAPSAPTASMRAKKVTATTASARRAAAVAKRAKRLQGDTAAKRAKVFAVAKVHRENRAADA